MLRISKLADYGTVVMVYLAKNHATLCNARDIAHHTHLSLPTVSKLLKRLTAAGLLSSVRGVAGGYRLQKAPEAITVTEIVYALDDARGLTECAHHLSDCSLQAVCHVQGNWRLISQALVAALDSVSLAMLASPTIHEQALDRIKHSATGVSRG